MLTPSPRWLLGVLGAHAAAIRLFPADPRRAEWFTAQYAYRIELPWIWMSLFGAVVMLGFLWLRPARNGSAFATGLTIILGSTAIKVAAFDFSSYSMGLVVEYLGYALFAAAAFDLESQLLPRRWLLLGSAVYCFAWNGAELLKPYLVEALIPERARTLLGLVLQATIVGVALWKFGRFRSDGDVVPSGSDPKTETVARADLIRLGVLLLLLGTGNALLQIVPTNMGYRVEASNQASIVAVTGWIEQGMLVLLYIVALSLRLGPGLILRWSGALAALGLAIAWTFPSLRLDSYMILWDLVSTVGSIGSLIVACRLANGSRLVTLGALALLQLVTYLVSNVVATRHLLENWTLSVPAYPLFPTVAMVVVVLGSVALLFAPSRSRRKPHAIPDAPGSEGRI